MTPALLTQRTPLDTCKRCGCAMVPGVALENTWVGMPDFIGDSHPMTVHPGGTGKLVACLKCPRCGWSTT